MSRQFHRPVIIAMAIMRVMQPSVHEVIDVITVRHAFVSAAQPMRVRAPGVGRAARRIGVADLNNMFVDMIPMHVVQMTIVEVIDMALMAHSRVSTLRTMLMGVIRMMPLVAEGHEVYSPILALVVNRACRGMPLQRLPAAKSRAVKKQMALATSARAKWVGDHGPPEGRGEGGH